MRSETTSYKRKCGKKIGNTGLEVAVRALVEEGVRAFVVEEGVRAFVVEEGVGGDAMGGRVGGDALGGRDPPEVAPLPLPVWLPLVPCILS